MRKGVDANAATCFAEVDPGTLEIRPARQPLAPRLANLSVEANRLHTFVVVGKTGDLEGIGIQDKLSGELPRD